MSHYTHFNLSPASQITVQLVFRTIAFMSETSVFAYIGLAIFSFHHEFKIPLILWSVVS
jgi:sodium/hydrogen exchanger 8